MAGRVSDALADASADSLPEYTAPTRLSPIVMIDRKVMDVDQGLLTALLQTLTSVYAAHYLQAISISMNIGDVNVLGLLDKFSTDRSLLRAAGSSKWGTESLDLDSTELPIEANWNLEGFIFNREQSDNDLGSSGKSNDKTIKTIEDESNLLVGKLIEVKLQSNDGKKEISIPVSINLVPKSIASDDLVSIVSHNSIDKSMAGRWHQWRAEEIEFLPDLLLNLDLIEADRKALDADRDGTLGVARSKRTKNILATIISGQMSPNAVSTMVIVSKETAFEMEKALGGKLKSSRVRDNYFRSNTAMMLVVVDMASERFTLYQRSIDDFGRYTLEDIKKNGNNSNGTDIEAVLKAYNLGNAPTL